VHEIHKVKRQKWVHDTIIMVNENVISHLEAWSRVWEETRDMKIAIIMEAINK
jgi:hypothetical protein